MRADGLRGRGLSPLNAMQALMGSAEASHQVRKSPMTISSSRISPQVSAHITQTYLN